MNGPYYDKLYSMLMTVRLRLSRTYQLEFENSFGAAACFLNGKIFIVCGKFGVALKLPQKTLSILFEQKKGNLLNVLKMDILKKIMLLFPNKY